MVSDLRLSSLFFCLALMLTCLPQAQAQTVGVRPVANADIPQTFGLGANIALNALGGKVLASVTDESYYEAADLIDGMIADETGSLNTSFGWSANATDAPVDLVFAFHKDRVARIAGLAITPWRFENAVPTKIEIYASETGLDGSWSRVGGQFGLKRHLGRQAFAFSEPVAAKVLWLRLFENGGSSAYHIGEVEVFETAETSILGDLDIDLARPALGGSLVRPPRGDRPAGGAIDGDPVSGYSTTYPADYVIFTHAFRDGAEAKISAIRMREIPNSAVPSPIRVKVEYSSGLNPAGDFEIFGEIDIPWSDGVAEIPITPNVKARFLRLTYFSAEGGRGLALAASEVIEAKTEGYASVPAALRAKDNPAARLADSSAHILEAQPDDTADSARLLALDSLTEQELWPSTDVDYLRVGEAPERTRLSLSVQLSAGSQPDVSLLHVEGESESITVGSTVNVKEGDILRVSRPSAASSVLLIDDSGSMEGTRGAVVQAVRGFFKSRLPHEETAVIRFSAEVAVLSDFSSDAEELLTAVNGQLEQAGGTALYDGIMAALDMLEGKRGDRAIVLLSDGANSAGEADLQAVWDRLTASGVRLYAVGLGSGLDYHGSAIGLAATPWRALQFFTGATSGQAMRAPTADSLKRIYEQISADLRAPSKYSVALAAQQIKLGELLVEYTGGILLDANAPVVEIIFDASGSMRDRKRKIDGRLKIDVAKEVTKALIDSLPDGTEVGLRVFGHRIQEGDEYDCVDIELIVPHGPLDRQEFSRAVDSIRALGTTPIYNSLLISLGDMRDLGPGPKKVLLITDGKEECQEPGDVVALAKGFEAFGVDLQLDVVGFALADEATKAILNEAAVATGGVFTDAQDASSLAEGLRQSFHSARIAARGATGETYFGEVGGTPMLLESGAYEVDVLIPNGPLTINNVDILEGERLNIVLSRDGSGHFGLVSSREKARGQ